MKKILYLILALVLSNISQAQIGGTGRTVEVLGGLKIDSVLVLPITTPFTGKGSATTGRIMQGVDSLPAYMKAGVIKKVITKYDSGTVYVDVGEVGQPNGVAGLNSLGVVPSINLPAITLSGQVYIDTSQAQMLSHASATAGALSVRTDSSSELFVLTATPSSTRANWHITQGNGVSAFNSRTGAVNPTSGDYTTTLVTEGSKLYFTASRTQSVIEGDTTIGWLVSGSRLIDTAAALRSSIASATVAIGSTVTGANNASILFNKGTKLGQDSHLTFDTTNQNIVMSNGSGNQTVMSAGSFTSVSLTTQSGLTSGTGQNILYFLNSGAASIVRLEPPSLSVTGNQVNYLRWATDSLALLGESAHWVKLSTVHYSDFSTAGTARTISSSYTLPAKTVISEVVINPTTAFSGGLISNYNISVGGTATGVTTRYLFNQTVFTGSAFAVSNALPNMESFVSSSVITVTAKSTGANLSAATAGAADIYLLVNTLP